MPDLQIISSVGRPRAASRRVMARWMVTFLGFPLAGSAGILAVGRVDGLGAALAGGLVTGAVLGAVQAWGLGSGRPPVAAWTAATALGLMVGLGVGARLVDYDTALSALVVQGALSGLAVGAAQSVLLLPGLGVVALAWPPALAAIWATGWATSTAIGVGVDDQFTIFGSSGALVVTVATVVLPLVLNRQRAGRP